MSTEAMRAALAELVAAANPTTPDGRTEFRFALDKARAALAQRADEPTYDAEFIGLQREELASLPDAAVAEAFRDKAGRNYREAYASLFRAHVIEKARTFASAAPATQRADEPVGVMGTQKGGVHVTAWNSKVSNQVVTRVTKDATVAMMFKALPLGTLLYTSAPALPIAAMRAERAVGYREGYEAALAAPAAPAYVPLSDREFDDAWIHRDCTHAIQRGDILAQFRSAGRAIEALVVARMRGEK